MKWAGWYAHRPTEAQPVNADSASGSPASQGRGQVSKSDLHLQEISPSLRGGRGSEASPCQITQAGDASRTRLPQNVPMRPLMSYDWQAITRNKAREVRSYAWHGCLLVRYCGWIARDVAMVLAAVVAVLGLGVLRLVWPAGFRRFLDG